MRLMITSKKAFSINNKLSFLPTIAEPALHAILKPASTIAAGKKKRRRCDGAVVVLRRAWMSPGTALSGAAITACLHAKSLCTSSKTNVTKK